MLASPFATLHSSWTNKNLILIRSSKTSDTSEISAISTTSSPNHVGLVCKYTRAGWKKHPM